MSYAFYVAAYPVSVLFEVEIPTGRRIAGVRLVGGGTNSDTISIRIGEKPSGDAIPTCTKSGTLAPGAEQLYLCDDGPVGPIAGEGFVTLWRQGDLELCGHPLPTLL